MNKTIAEIERLEMELDGKKIAQYRATTKIYFDIEKSPRRWSAVGGGGKSDPSYVRIGLKQTKAPQTH